MIINKSITFNKNAQDCLPQHIKDKMKKQREESNLNNEIDIDKKYQDAISKVEEAYNDKDSPHYRDNERYSWAINIINERFKK